MRYLLMLSTILILLGCQSDKPDDSIEVDKTEVPKQQKEVVKSDTVELAPNDSVPEDPHSDDEVHKEVKLKPDENKKEQESEATSYKNEERETPDKKVLNNKYSAVYPFLIDGIGIDLKEDYKLDLMTTAAEEVAIIRTEDCDNCGKVIVLKNYNSDQLIEAVVECKWKIGKEKKSLRRLYNLKSKEELNLGCSDICSESIKVRWNVISAKHKN